MTFVIAEAGVNHGGNLDTAIEMVKWAKWAGADAVKFQYFDSQRLWGDDRIKHLELDFTGLSLLELYCSKLGIEFMVTPFGVPEVEKMRELVKRWKVASGCLERWPLLEAIRETRLPVIMSTGMAGVERIGAALARLGYLQPGEYTQAYALLHCVSAYPCRVEDANLAAMDVLRHHHGHRCQIGYSDHTQGITVALAAVARGAQIIEKHLTLDRNAEGPDHKASIEPTEFRVMVSAIRTVEAALGDGVKRAQASERETMEAWYGDKR